MGRSHMRVEAAVSVRVVLARSMSCPPSIIPHRSTLYSSSRRAASNALGGRAGEANKNKIDAAVGQNGWSNAIKKENKKRYGDYG